MDIKFILPFHLRGGALTIYQELNNEEKGSLQHVKQALIAAYAPNLFNTYNQFVVWWLCPEETANEYLADMRWIDSLVSDWQTACTFILGLLQHIRKLLQASSWMDTVTVEQLVAQVRAIMTDTEEPDEIAAVTQPSHALTRSQKHEIIYHKCSGPNHLSRNCLLRCVEVAADWPPQSFRMVWCFQCNDQVCYLRVFYRNV